MLRNYFAVRFPKPLARKRHEYSPVFLETFLSNQSGAMFAWNEWMPLKKAATWLV
jgi:hypothetical protein